MLGRYLAGWAEAYIKAGDEATLAGYEPHVGDVIDLGVAMGGSLCRVDGYTENVVSVTTSGKRTRELYTREEWELDCTLYGHLVSRGSADADNPGCLLEPGAKVEGTSWLYGGRPFHVSRAVTQALRDIDLNREDVDLDAEDAP